MTETRPENEKEKPAARSARSTVLKSLAGLTVGVLLVLAVLYFLDATDPRELFALATFDAPFIALGFLGTLAASLVTAARWRLLADVLGGTSLPYRVYFSALVITRFVGQFTSVLFMDLVGRGSALKYAGSDRDLGHSAAQVVLERILDFLLPLSLLGWVFAVRNFPIPQIPTLLLVCVMFFVGAIVFLAPAARTTLLAYSRLRSFMGRPPVEIPRPPVDLALSAKVASYSLLRFAAVVVQFWGIARGVGVDIDALEMTVATPVAQLAGLVGLTPGGLGVVEAGWAGGLQLVGLDWKAIGLFVLAQRLGVVLFFGLLSLLSLPLQRFAK